METLIQPGDVKLYALLPYTVKGLVLGPDKDSVPPGAVMRYTVNLESDGQKPGLHVFRIEVFGPDGKPRAHYGAKLLAEQGRAEGELRLALNDAPGKWTLRASDIATRRTGACNFQVGQ